MRIYDDPEASRSVSTRLEARNSLRRFKGTAEYRRMLKTTIADSAKRETSGTEAERRRAKLDRLQANLELETLTTGGKPDEFSGLLALPDPLKMEG